MYEWMINIGNINMAQTFSLKQIPRYLLRTSEVLQQYSGSGCKLSSWSFQLTNVSMQAQEKSANRQCSFYDLFSVFEKKRAICFYVFVLCFSYFICL